MRGSSERVLGKARELLVCVLGAEQQDVTMRDCGQPVAGSIELGESRRQIRKKQASRVETVALADTRNPFCDLLDTQRSGTIREVLDGPLRGGARFDRPRTDLFAHEVSRTRGVTKLQSEMDIGAERLGMQPLLTGERAKEVFGDQPRKDTIRRGRPRRDLWTAVARPGEHADDSLCCLGGRVVVLVARNTLEASQIDACPVVEIDSELELRLDSKIGAGVAQGIGEKPDYAGDGTVAACFALGNP